MPFYLGKIKCDKDFVNNSKKPVVESCRDHYSFRMTSDVVWVLFFFSSFQHYEGTF